MGAAHGDGGTQAHQFRQHFCAANDGDQFCARLSNFWVARRQWRRRRRRHAAPKFSGPMADMNLNPQFPQALDIGAILNIRSCHGIAWLCSSSAMPDMPMPPIPTKWIRPKSSGMVGSMVAFMGGPLSDEGKRRQILGSVGGGEGYGRGPFAGGFYHRPAVLLNDGINRPPMFLFRAKSLPRLPRPSLPHSPIAGHRHVGRRG